EVIDAPGARGRLARMPPDAIRDHIATTIKSAHPALDVAPQPETSWLGAKIVAIACAVVLAPLIALLFYPWYRLLKHAEATEPVADPASRPVHDDDHHQEFEDEWTQNQLTHIVDIKPGWFRLFTVWIVLTVIDVLARVEFVNGDLGGITSIHFARWVI